jgi:hypothetical protein
MDFVLEEESRSAEGGRSLPESPSLGETTGERARCPRNLFFHNLLTGWKASKVYS